MFVNMALKLISLSLDTLMVFLISCYAAFGCMIKKSEGDYSHILNTFGPFPTCFRLLADSSLPKQSEGGV